MKNYSFIAVALFMFSVSSVYAEMIAQPVMALSSQSVSATSCFELSYTLTLRSKDVYTNGEVTKLQKFLQHEGFLSVEPSGYFGAATQKALKSYQRQYGISPTGNAGPLTRKTIKEKSCKANAAIPLITPQKGQGVVSSSSVPVVQVQNPVISEQNQNMVNGAPVPSPQDNVLNYMSCSNPSFKKLANGQIGCYGIWNPNHTFGDDTDRCPEGGYSPGVGCKVITMACEAGQAFATRAIKPGLLDISSEDLNTFAKNLRSTPDIVKQQVSILWEYRCSDYGLSTYGTQKP